jgi:two-component system, NtrC family, response regulator AtoC
VGVALEVPRTIGREAGDEGRLQAVVVEGDAVTVHDLPAIASVLVGRGGDAGIQLTDPSASARHARLHVQEGRVSIEDLASRNGTQVRGQKIGANQPVPLATGEAAMLGSAVLIVQSATRRLGKRRAWPQGSFEMRVAEECDASQGGSATFSLARLDLDRSMTADAFLQLAESSLRPSDIVGVYGPGAFEILLRRTTREGAEESLARVLAQLGTLARKARFALAHYPADGQTAEALVEKACVGVRREGSPTGGPGVIVVDEKMKEVYRLAEKAAGANINVLILGETGVGKEVMARTIHQASKRASGPLLCINSAAVAETLLESELFGYERGAFTDAKATKPGLLESASGGTVFLDEIGEMSPTMQAKLLRVIETKQVTRVGGSRPVDIDVRFLAATHRDLVEEIREKRFRSDLYYRLNGIPIEIPPLRERTSEIRPMAEAFLKLESGSTPPPLSDEVVSLLEAHPWPGNIRELRNVMARANVLADGGNIEPEDLPTELRAPSPPPPVNLDDLVDEADDRWNKEEKAECAEIVAALRAEGGNQTRAARRLGISRGTLVARIGKYALSRPRKR